MTTVLDTIDKGTAYLEKKGIDDARRNMQLLVTHQLGCSRVELYMQFDRPMTEEQLTPLREKLKRRGHGEPLQHLLGTVEFYRREFKTDARALIPRPETEELTALILSHPALKIPPTLTSDPEPLSVEPDQEQTLPDSPPQADSYQLRILDMGTGSGVLGLSLALEFGGRCQEIILADISPDALELAGENASLLGVPRLTLCESQLFSNLEGESFHILAANLPYIAETDRDSLSPEVQHDPPAALFGGKDGLDILRDFIQQAPSHMHPGGIIALEIGHNQAEAVESMLESAGFTDITTHKDLNQIPRFPIASYPGPPEPLSPPNSPLPIS
ncbi:MAG: peptide chain release factor N(5)-glutamine methyltransferase [Verrucomicrobiae bacterium]|nr:peptide chain release factor N(5)-glutamine methyltransferase [Verrucomicrobiae bacterium]NNJ41913.1 peptide chain release factor N(5)-glutamine methyltransferase [Akkermansiaceae bacterium]